MTTDTAAVALAEAIIDCEMLYTDDAHVEDAARVVMQKLRAKGWNLQSEYDVARLLEITTWLSSIDDENGIDLWVQRINQTAKRDKPAIIKQALKDMLSKAPEQGHLLPPPKVGV